MELRVSCVRHIELVGVILITCVVFGVTFKAKPINRNLGQAVIFTGWHVNTTLVIPHVTFITCNTHISPRQYPHGQMSHNLGPGLTCTSPAISSTIKVKSLAGLSELREVWDLGTSRSLLAVHRPSMRMCCTWSVIDAETGVPGTMVSNVVGICATAQQPKQQEETWQCLVVRHVHRSWCNSQSLGWNRVRDGTSLIGRELYRPKQYLRTHHCVIRYITKNTTHRDI